MEPGEVEAIVASMDDVNGCIVKLIKPVQVINSSACSVRYLIFCHEQDQPQHDFLCAYVSLVMAKCTPSEQASTPGTLFLLPTAFSTMLEALCTSSLPKFMVPKVFVSCPVWPRTLSGKISRLEIPAPSESLLHELVLRRNK
jgi:hypothetical protein